MAPKTQKKTEVTTWKTNMSPENQWLEDVFPTEIVPLKRGTFVSFRGCNSSQLGAAHRTEVSCALLNMRLCLSTHVAWWWKVDPNESPG